MNHLANAITSTRFLLAGGLLLVPPFSAPFWAFYCLAAVSDGLDGFVARRTGTASSAGARLDSAADLCFMLAVLFVLVKTTFFLPWQWPVVLLIFALRMAAYLVGYCRFRVFAALHTYLNKLAGVLCFAFPLCRVWFHSSGAELVLLLVILLSAGEELVILATARELDRDRKSIFPAFL